MPPTTSTTRQHINTPDTQDPATRFVQLALPTLPGMPGIQKEPALNPKPRFSLFGLRLWGCRVLLRIRALGAFSCLFWAQGWALTVSSLELEILGLKALGPLRACRDSTPSLEISAGIACMKSDLFKPGRPSSRQPASELRQGKLKELGFGLWEVWCCRIKTPA